VLSGDLESVLDRSVRDDGEDGGLAGVLDGGVLGSDIAGVMDGDLAVVLDGGVLATS
jgi:hypothetical protein